MNTKQSFIKGAAILICANAISKILGAVFKIPLTYLLREEGMAIYNTGFNVYVMLLSFIISGMPLAISKMIAEETALGNETAVRKIMAVSTALLGVLGILGSAALWFGADFFAISMKEPKAIFCLKTIAPSVFFVAIGTVYKSYYQGRANMIPTAVSQVIEAVIKLLAGYGLALLYCGYAAQYTVAAAIMGVTIGEIIATFILFVLYLPHCFRMPGGQCEKSGREILKTISAVALPAILASAVSGAMNLVDITVIRRCLEGIKFTKDGAEAFLRLYSSYTDVFDSLPETLSISSEGSRWLYGAYSGYALTVFHLPVGILGALGVSILPVISGSIAVKNYDRACLCAGLSVKLTMLVCLPSAFAIALFSEPILDFLFNNTASARMLAYLAPCLIFISLSQIYGAILNAGGSITEPLIFGFAGSLVKLVCNFIFIRNQYINMTGTIISANIAYFVVMLLSCIKIKKMFPSCIGIRDNFLKPLFCAAFMAAVMYTLYSPFVIIFNSDKTALILSGAVGGISYVLMLLFSNCISGEEIKMLKKE